MMSGALSPPMRASLMAHSMRKNQTRFARALGFTSYIGHLPPGVEQFTTVLKDRAHYRFLRPCSHIEAKSPEHAVWFASEPDALRCKTCSTFDLYDRYRQPDQLVCDQCRRRDTAIQVGVSLTGCVYLVTALCPACLEGPA